MFSKFRNSKGIIFRVPLFIFWSRSYNFGTSPTSRHWISTLIESKSNLPTRSYLYPWLWLAAGDYRQGGRRRERRQGKGSDRWGRVPSIFLRHTLLLYHPPAPIVHHPQSLPCAFTPGRAARINPNFVRRARYVRFSRAPPPHTHTHLHIKKCTPITIGDKGKGIARFAVTINTTLKLGTRDCQSTNLVKLKLNFPCFFFHVTNLSRYLTKPTTIHGCVAQCNNIIV